MFIRARSAESAVLMGGRVGGRERKRETEKDGRERERERERQKEREAREALNPKPYNKKCFPV